MRILLFSLGILALPTTGCCLPAPEVPNADGSRRAPAAYESPYRFKSPGTWIDNGMLRVRADDNGIMWFDVFHPEDRKWYVNKNNLNLSVIVDGKQENTELARVQPEIEVREQTDASLQARYRYAFENGARVSLDMFIEKGNPELRFVAHQSEGSKKIDAFMWHITFGQAEAVQKLRWRGKEVDAAKLDRPFPGGRLKVQHVSWFDDVPSLDFRFWGDETAEPDPNNPRWMSRVLGLRQRAIWTEPLRREDKFAFEARDQPWQKSWGMPEVTPWIEGLWVVRKGDFLEGDTLIFRIEDLYEGGGAGEKRRKKKKKR